jgi:hypothetical protein
MNKTLVASLAMAATLMAVALLGKSDAQTPQGDMLRAQGRFLEGAGWYNLNTARADRINVETWKSYNREVQRLYRDFLLDKHLVVQRDRRLGSRVQEEVQRKFEEAQNRWRTSPSPEDISSGAALNALAADLADSSIAPSSWRTAQVELPTSMSLTSLAFVVADKKRSSLLQSTVAVDRMLIKDGWPLPFRRSDVESECKAYKKAVDSVVAKCTRGTELQGKDFDQLRDSVSILLKKVEESLTTRDNQRGQARDYVRRLDDATRIFAEQEYAERLIRDVTEHKATTIAELLGFMRYHRLLFSDSGSSPEVRDLYDGLYSLLRKQKDALGIKDAPPPKEAMAAKAALPSDVFQAGTTWVGAGQGGAGWQVTVMERSGDGFKARFKIGNNMLREVRGEVQDDMISWSGRNIHVLKGPPVPAKGGGSMVFGIFHGTEIHIKANNPKARVNVVVLHRTK